MSKYQAIGVHVFAGGFTMGVKAAGFEVPTQLEVHDLGSETAREIVGVDVHTSEADDWPVTSGHLAYGNPRCTAFSALTGGCGANSHGPWARQTQDAVEFCQYTAGKFDFCVWESVQQAYTTGKPLLDRLAQEFFYPRHYRVCHLFCNAASHENSQNRRRYFFVAYRDRYKFNVSMPKMMRQPTVGEVLAAHPHVYPDGFAELSAKDDANSGNVYMRLTPEERHALPYLKQGMSLNKLARECPESLTPKQRNTWDNRRSDKPFSLHCVRRLDADDYCPTIHSGAKKWIHPTEDRPFTTIELARLMGWPVGSFPVGPMPVEQIAKGIVPAVGEWIARQVIYSLSGWWDDDWETAYCKHEGRWLGQMCTQLQREKIIDTTEFYEPCSSTLT